MTSLQAVAVDGIGRIRPGDDLASIIAAALDDTQWPDASAGIRDGDIVVVTSLSLIHI